MPSIKIYNQTGAETGTLELLDSVFGLEPNTVVMHEAVEFGGFGGEIVSTITASDAFYYLDAPIKRVGSMACPMPFNPNLEREALPNVNRIEAAVREIL